MATKITLTLSQDENQGTDEAMAETVALLASLGVVPLAKVTLALECSDDEAEALADEIDAVLSGRPMGIEATLKTQHEHRIERRKVAGASPMDKAGWN